MQQINIKKTYGIDVVLVLAPSIMDVTFSNAKSLYKPVEPIGLLYIAASLLSQGLSVRILDCNAEGLSVSQSVSKIQEIDPFILGISCLTQEAFMVEALLVKVRQALPNTIIVMGNIHSSCFPEYYLSKGIADMIMLGEGEAAFPQLVKYLKKGDYPDTLEGLVYLDDNNKLIKNEPKPIDNLDSLPFPAWHLVDLKKYKYHFYYHFNPKVTRNMVTSRGCPIGCSFCTIHDGQKVRFHSYERMIEEIDMLMKHYGMRQIMFQDPMFLAKRSRIEGFCDSILQKNIKIGWACEVHVNYAKKDLFKLMKQAGCHTVFYGIETADDILLKNIGKKSTIEQIEKAVWMAKETGLNPVGFFMLGLPGETEELTYKTLKFSLKLPLDMAVFSILIPFPGSRLFEELKQTDPQFNPYNWNGFNNTGILGKHPPEWNPKGLPYATLSKIQAMAYRKFNFRPKMVWRHFKTLKYADMHDIQALINMTLLTLRKRI
ncbi:MAG: B12-binding domain-containing radical SAM protein [Desulfobacterales bacterium]|nr:B12-binding domain-containing radical SAM protein [Desulfobacterales bacterium]